MSTQKMLKWDSFIIWSSQVKGWYRVRLAHYVILQVVLVLEWLNISMHTHDIPDGKIDA